MPAVTEDEWGWREHRACAPHPPQWFVGELNAEQTARAKAVCAACPVIEQCRALGDEAESVVLPIDLQGVWAGENPLERARRRRRRGDMPPTPG